MNTKHLLMTFLLATALPASAQESRYVGGDISLLPTYEEHGANYMDKDGNEQDLEDLYNASEEIKSCTCNQ